MVSPYKGKMPNGSLRIYGGQPTYGQWDGKRFIYVLKKKTYKVHRLICEAFHGTPKPGQVCMHLDENSKNNSPTNLAWGTQKENLNAVGFLQYCRSRVGKNSPTFKHKEKNVKERFDSNTNYS